jgi:hypothetical protein
MFIRQSVTSIKNKKYIKHNLVESARTPKGPRQNLVLCLGTLDLPKDQWKSLANAIEAKCINASQQSFFSTSPHILDLADHYVSLIQKNNLNNSNTAQSSYGMDTGDFETVDIHSLSHGNSRTIGAEHIVHTELNKYTFDSILAQLEFTSKDRSFARLLVASRLIHPASERETVRWLEENSALPELVNHDDKLYENALHRIASKLFENKEHIEDALSQKAVDLFDLQENIILYDLTNTFFESPKRESEIAQYGKSKERRNDTPLVTLALTVDEDGFPKRSTILKGNISEPETLEDVLHELKKDKRALQSPALSVSSLSTSAQPSLPQPSQTQTIVIDAGIATEENLTLIRTHGFHYIAVSRRKKYDEKLWKHAEEKKILLADAKTHLTVQRTEGNGEVLLLCKSPDKAKKEEAMQKRRRDKFEKELTTINEKLNNPRSIKQYEKIIERVGRLKERYKVGQLYEITYKKTKNIVIEIKFKQIKNFNKTPGEYVIRTDRTDLTEEQISKLHRSLTRVEAGFKTLKQEAGLRPNYHKIDKMMKAHIYISVLAFHFISGIIKQLRNAGIHYSWNSVRNIMSSHTRITTTMTTKEGETVTIRDTTKPTLKQKEIYHALKIPQKPLSRKKYTSKSVVTK